MPRKKYHRRMQTMWYGDDFLEVVRKYGDEAWMAAGKHLLRVATDKAPRGRTGNLRKSGYVSTNSQSTYVYRRGWRKEKKAPEGGAIVGFSAPHAHLIEGGRRSSGKIYPRRRRSSGGGGGWRGRLAGLFGSGRRAPAPTRRALYFGGRFASVSRYRRMSSRPFLAPALEETKETMVLELSGVLRTKLEKMLGFVSLR